MGTVAEPPHLSVDTADIIDAAIVAFPDARDIERVTAS
jgi:hypothetical protein